MSRRRLQLSQDQWRFEGNADQSCFVHQVSYLRKFLFPNEWVFIFVLRELYTLGEEGAIFYVWSHARSKVYNVEISKPKVKRGLATRSPLRRYPASCTCDANMGSKLRKKIHLRCKHIALVYSYFFSVWFAMITSDTDDKYISSGVNLWFRFKEVEVDFMGLDK